MPSGPAQRWRSTAPPRLTTSNRQAIAALRPQAVPGGPAYVEDPYEVVRWVWFYEPADDGGIPQTKVYEVAEDIIVVEADGTARWNLTAEQITVDHLLRSADGGRCAAIPCALISLCCCPRAVTRSKRHGRSARGLADRHQPLGRSRPYTLLRGARREEIQKDLNANAGALLAVSDVVAPYRVLVQRPAQAGVALLGAALWRCAWRADSPGA